MSDRNEKFFDLTNMPSELDEDCGTTWKESFRPVIREFRKNAYKCKNVVIYPNPPEEEPDIANALKTLCSTLDKTSEFIIFWSHSVRSLFKLEKAPERDPAISFESFVFSDSHPPMLFIFTKTPSTSKTSAAPDLTTYRIGLAKALMSKLQYFTSDLICVLSVVVESGVHTPGELKDIVKKAENDARSTMSDKRLQMHERKYIGLLHSVLAAIAMTLTLQGSSGESSVHGEKYKFLQYEPFTAVVECLSRRGVSKVSAARAHCRKDLVAEIAWRHSLSKPTLLVSDDPPGEEHPARQSTGLDVVGFSSSPPLKEYACIVVDNIQNISGDKGRKWQNFLATLPSDKTAILIDDDVDTMAVASQKFWEDIRETLLTCKICVEPFDRKERLPRALPCQHTFCGPCIAKLDKEGQLSCPNCRQKTPVTESFPIDLACSALLECMEVIETAQEAVCEGCYDGTKATSRCLDCNQTFCEIHTKSHKKGKTNRKHELVSLEKAIPSLSQLLQKVEMCQKHSSEKLKFYCKTCKSAICSSCVIIQHKDGHEHVEPGEVPEQTKHQIESQCSSLNIREFRLHSRANFVATKPKTTEAVNVHTKQKAQTLERLESKRKADIESKSQAAAQENEGEKPPLLSPRRKMTSDRPDPRNSLQNLDTTNSVTSRSTEVHATPAVTSSAILIPEFLLEPDRCRLGCRLWGDRRTLNNKPRSKSGGTGQSGSRSFAFLGTCGSVDLAQPALHYWIVDIEVSGGGSGDRCEFGLASLQTLDTCDRDQRISDHDVDSATLVVVVRKKIATLEGRNWTVDTPQPHQSRDVSYACLLEGLMNLKMTLGFLYDNRQPQSPRVLVVEAESCRLLGVRRLSPSSDLRPVFRVWPTRDKKGGFDISLKVRTGPTVIGDSKSMQLRSMLEGMTDERMTC